MSLGLFAPNAAASCGSVPALGQSSPELQVVKDMALVNSWSSKTFTQDLHLNMVPGLGTGGAELGAGRSEWFSDALSPAAWLAF